MPFSGFLSTWNSLIGVSLGLMWSDDKEKLFCVKKCHFSSIIKILICDAQKKFLLHCSSKVVGGREIVNKTLSGENCNSLIQTF